MEYDGFLLGLLLLFLILLGVMVFVGIGLLAGYIASWLGFHGLMWWSVTIVIYVVIGGFIAMIYRIGGN